MPTAVFVDRDEEVLNSLQRKAADHLPGWQIEVFSDARDFMKLITDEQPFNILFVDFMGGLGVDGVDIANRARESIKPDDPMPPNIILLSNNPVSYHYGHESPFDMVIDKNAPNCQQLITDILNIVYKKYGHGPQTTAPTGSKGQPIP